MTSHLLCARQSLCSSAGSPDLGPLGQCGAGAAEEGQDTKGGWTRGQTAEWTPRGESGGAGGGLVRGGGGCGMNWEIVIVMYTLICIK